MKRWWHKMGYRTCRWNKEEETQLMEYVNDEVSWEDISRELQRSIPACKKRMKTIDKKLIEAMAELHDSMAVQEETAQYLADESQINFDDMSKVIQDYLKPEWDNELDLDLLIHFYDLSIDEARDRYGMNYADIASRLEHLVDSSEPEHIDTLMQATEIVRSRKEYKDAQPKLSLRERLQLRKLRKLETKVALLRYKVTGKYGSE